MSKTQYLVLVRHGQSEANLELATTPCGLYYSQSGSDPAVLLTPHGLKQGTEVGCRLARMFPESRKLSRAYHTGYERVVRTLTQIEEQLPYTPERILDSRLEKRSYGQFWNLTRRGVEELYPDEWQRYQEAGDLAYRAPEGGENYFDVFARVDAFVDDVLSNSEDNLLVVTHSVVLLSFQRRFEQLSDEEVLRRYEEQELPNAHILVFCRDGKDKAWERCDDEQIGLHSPGL